MRALDTCYEDFYLKCANDRCIPWAFRCDGKNDCGVGDNTDEVNCTGDEKVLYIHIARGVESRGRPRGCRPKSVPQAKNVHFFRKNTFLARLPVKNYANLF